MIRYTVRTILVAGLLAAFLSTAGEPAAAGGRQESPGGTAPRGVPGTLVFGLSGDPDTLDPQATSGTLTFQVLRSVYDTLVEPDTTGEIVPALAERWEISPDGLEWRFFLRRGVQFHHGSELTSRDVAATLERVKDPAYASPNAFEYAMIREVTTPDNWTVVLHLEEPHAPLLATLASGWSAILPADLIEAGHPFATRPVGTGPFQFTRWVRDSEIQLQRNDQYWQAGRPYMSAVRFQIITEQAVMAQALLAGEIHVADIVVEPELSMLRASPNVELYESTSALVMVLAINTSRPPLDQLEVRRAINAAIDKQLVLDQAYAGGIPVGTFMDVGNPFYRDFTDMHRYDPEFARDVAARTTFPRELVITLPQNFEPHVRAGEMYHEMLRQAGFPVRTRLVDWSTWIGDVFGQSQFDLTVIGHTGKLDPHGRLARYGTAETYVRWEDAETAAAIDAARRISDPEERRALYDIALERMARSLPFVFVGSPYRFVGLRRGITGFHMDNQLDTADLRNVQFTSP